MENRKKTYLLRLIGLLLLCLQANNIHAEIDDCETGRRWQAYLLNDETNDYKSYSPSEFFTENGADVPDYSGEDINEHAYFEFSDTTCRTDEWRLIIRGVASKLFYGTVTTSLGVDLIPYSKDPELGKQGKPEPPRNKIEINNIQNIEPSTKNGLKYAFTSEFVFVLEYKDDKVRVWTSDGREQNPILGHVCRVGNITTSWRYKGDSGRLTEILFEDFTNGTTYHEDFSDCSATQEYPKCEPDPVLDIKAEFILPNCEDSTLRLKAEANYPVEFHWEGPDGFKSDEQNPIIDYKNATSGRYMVWARLDPCLDPVVTYIDIEVPQLKYHTENSLYTCHGDTVWVGDTYHTENGIYRDTLKTADGCDSVVVSSLHFDYRHHEIEATDCSAKGYFFNGEYLHFSGTYTDTVKVPGCNCDSIVTLRLTAIPVERTVFNLDLCKEDSAIAEGHVFRETGVVRDTLKTDNGCDSLVIFNVKMNPQADTLLTYRVCSDDPVTGPDGIVYDRDTFFTKLVAFEGYKCKVKTTFDVKVSEAVHIPDTTISLCNTKTVKVVVDSFLYASYTWVPSTGVDDPHSCRTNVTLDGDNMDYKLYIERGYCADSALITITSDGTPVISLLEYDAETGRIDINVEKGIPPYAYQLDGTAANNWSPTLEDCEPEIGVHVVYVTDARGCTVRKPFHYFVPVIPASYMTPNGDGIRDTWEIKNIELYDKYVIKIFDRWGKLLKRYDNYYDGWDGTYQGVKMPTTDYWYSISVDGNDQDIAGHFTLRRK